MLTLTTWCRLQMDGLIRRTQWSKGKWPTGLRNLAKFAPLAANDESASPMAVKGIGNWEN